MRDLVDPLTGVAATREELEAQDWDNDITLGGNGPMHFVIFQPGDHLFYVAAGKLPIFEQPYTCFSLEELLGLPNSTPCDPATL